MDDADATFARFLTDRRPALLGTALLLTGDRRSAEELVQRGLTRARRRWPRDPEGAVLRAMTQGVTSRWARLARADQVIESMPAPFAAPPDSPDLAGALQDLSPRTRATVVLRWHEGLPDERIAQLLGCPVGTVATAAAQGLDRLAAAVPPSPYERVTVEAPVEQRLHDQLARLAGAPGPWRLDPDHAAVDVRARRHAARRRLAWGVVAVLCVVGGAVPLARRAPDPAPAPAAASPSAPLVPSAPVPSPPVRAPAVPVLTGPTRGSLAGDAGFVAAVRTVPWGGLEAPPPAEREVVFAGDTPHGRVALVVGTVLEDFRGVWLTGPVGAPAEDLVPHLPAQLGRDRPLTLLVGGPGEATLVVVAARGDDVAVSDRLMTGPRGTVGRTYLPVDTVDGVAVVPARTTAVGPALSVRVARDGQEVYRGAADWPGAGTQPFPPLPEPTPIRPGAAPDPYLVTAALTDLAVPLGVEPTDLQPELLWSADLPLDGGTGSVAVLVAQSPGGALVVTTWAGLGGHRVSCGTQTPPGTTPIDSLGVARVCEVPEPAPGRNADSRWLVVTAPPAAAAAQLLDAGGRVLRPLLLIGGGAVTPLPDDAHFVRTLDAHGEPLGELPIAPSPTDPFGDFGSGPER